MINALETALYNALVAGSVGVNWYNTLAPSKTATPFGVFIYVSGGENDTNTTQHDVLTYDIRIVDDSQDGLNAAYTAASYADKARAALSGADALNITGSLSGLACVELRRESAIKYLDAGGYWHVGDKWRIRVSKTL